MGVLSNVLLIIGILALIEGGIISLFPDWSMKLMKSMVKSAKKLRQIGIIEIIIALVLILIGMNI
jgi:uncharacterized protein YjeT (DUF2065 family)